MNASVTTGPQRLHVLLEGACAEKATPLERDVRRALEAAFGADLGAVRVHTGTKADALTRALHADALAHGAHIFFRSGATIARTGDASVLLFHEVAHVLQRSETATSSGPFHVCGPDEPCERQATRVSIAAARGGTPPPVGTCAAGGGRLVVHRHESFEHRIFGDVPTDRLTAIALRRPKRGEAVAAERDLMALFADKPEQVTEDDVRSRCPWVRVLRLRESDLLVTYGEINALPDYIADPVAIDDLGASVLLPILQCIREQGFNQMNRLLGSPTADAFRDAIAGHCGHGALGAFVKSVELDEVTKHLGVEGTDQYKSLLARNACHFAPYSWFRWQAFHMVARDLACRAAAGDGARDELTRRAWVAAGYADHFLQDSFASGHLVNKTLVMQHFVEWAASRHDVSIPGFHELLEMTTARQPDVAGEALYDPAFRGPSNDPQTVEEHTTLEARMAATGLRAGANGLERAYRCYLSFLDAMALQAAAGLLHDHFNATSLWVTSRDHTEPYQVWGDATMLDGGDGAGIASETTKLAQQAIEETLANGSTTIEVQQILDRFPISASEHKSVPTQPLLDWNRGLASFCAANVFPHVHADALRIVKPTIGRVSRDQ